MADPLNSAPEGGGCQPDADSTNSGHATENSGSDMADPSHSVPPGGGHPDHGSRSDNRGQRKRAGPGSAAGQGAGGPGDSQSPQQVTRQLGSDGDHGSMSDNRGQRKRAGPGSAAGQDAGGSGGSQSPQQVTRQPGSDGGDLTGARKGLSSADGKPTVYFKSGSNVWRTETSPLTYNQWKHIDKKLLEKLLEKLSLMFGAKCRSEENVITFANERPPDDPPQWADYVLHELEEMSSKICSTECEISVQHLESFQDQWKKEQLSKTSLVTCIYTRSSPQCTMTILSEDEKVLQMAKERANVIIGTLEQSVIDVPWPYFDDRCFQCFFQPDKFPTVSVSHGRKDVGTHEIKVVGPYPDRERVSTKISSIVAAFKMMQMNWPEAGLWMSRTENQKYLRKHMKDNYPSILPVFGDENLFLVGPKSDVEEAQPLLQKMLCTGYYTLSKSIWMSLKQSVKAEDEGEESCFIPKYHLLASYDPSTEQLKLVGPLGCHTRLLQNDVKIHLKKPAPELEIALQNENVMKLVFPTTKADTLEIEGHAARVQEAYQLIREACAKAESLASRKNPLHAKEISKDRLMTLLLMKAVKAEVDNHLSLPGTDLADVKWRVNETARHVEFTSKDKNVRDKAEREIKSLFVEGETTLKDMDEAAADRLRDSWPNLMRDLHEHNECCFATFDHDNKWVLLASLKDRFDTTSKRMCDLIELYQKDQPVKRLHLSRAQYKYLMKEWKNEVAAVQHEVERNEGTFKFQPVRDDDDDDWQISMTGSLTVVSTAMYKLSQLQENIHVEATDVAVSCLASTEEGREFVSHLEEQYKCFIDIPEPPAQQRGNLSGYGEVILGGGTTVSLQHGPLKAEGVDLVALPVPVDLENKTRMIKVPDEYFNILPDVRTHLSPLREKLRKNKEKVLLVTPPRKLQCRKVALMAVPSTWYDGTKCEKGFLRSAVRDLMEMTMREQCSSVALEIPSSLPENAAEKPILFDLREFFVKETAEAASPTGIKTVRLFTRRQRDSTDPSQLLENAFAGLLNSAKRKIVIAAADKKQARGAAHELSKFVTPAPEENEGSLDADGTGKEMQKYPRMDISARFPYFKKKVCASEKSIFAEAEGIMKKLVGCSISSSKGTLYLHCPTEKEERALALCQQFDKLIQTAESGISSFASSTTPKQEYDEILVNAARKFFPEKFQRVTMTKTENGKVVLAPALSPEDQNQILGLQLSEVPVKDVETEKPDAIRSAFLKDADIYVEYLPSKKVVVAVVRKYDLMQTALSRIKVHLGQMKTAVRGKREFTTQPGRSDLDAREVSAAVSAETAERAAEEVTGADNKITLPGGLVVIPYRADIIRLRVDAIVNAANEHLSHRGGVARAISDAAGPDLDQECEDYIALSGPIGVTEVCVTGPGSLPCTRVIHAVGPRWNSRNPDLCRQQLYDTVLNCCREADRWDLGEIAMPAISSGIFGMPQDQCTKMYCKALLDYDQQPNKKLKTVHFVDIKDDMPLALLKALRKEIGQGQQRTRPPEAAVDLSQGCVICTDNKFDQPVKLNDCNHVFCKACLENWFKEKPTCPSCNKVYGIITGTMPPGTMNVYHDRYSHLAGFESCGCIQINYSLPDGFQKAEHPNPRQPYKGARRTAYLPDNAEGNKVLKLLREAWNRKLTFTIGRSTTTSQENVVTWNDIHHKTSTSPGHPFGYPDPDYLTRVQEELAARGVTEESIRLAQSGNPQDFSQFYTPLRPPRPTNAPHLG